MPSSLATADLQVGRGELSSGAPQQEQGLVCSGLSRAGEPSTAWVQEKKHSEGQGAAQPSGEPSLEQGVEERALAAGMLWSPAPGEGLQLGF